jgi:hypothetical protein
MPSRRRFIQQLTVLAGGAAVPASIRGHNAERTDHRSDEEICRDKFDVAARESLHERPIGEVIAAMGVSFLGTPYVAGTLEAPDEHLVINLRGLDCVTFVENVLTLSRCIKSGRTSFDDYKAQLQFIRYRDGNIDGYPSRLHYFSDWIGDNERKNIVRDMSREIGVRQRKQIHFMTSHPTSYKLLANGRFLEKIRETESVLSARDHYYVPKAQLSEVEALIESGDIIAITTSIDGLDVIHTGLALRSNGVLKYLHAPLSKGKVQISEQSLVKYLAGNLKHTGVMVARPLEPVS